MKLIYYELKKLCSSPYLVGVVAVLLIASMIFFSISVKEESEYEIKYKKLTPDIIEIYETNPEFFFSEHQRLYDALILDSFVPEYNYGEEGVADDYELFSFVYRFAAADDEYHEKLDSVINESKRIKARLERASEMNKGTFAYRYQLDVIDRYTYLNENVTLDDSPVFGWQGYFETTTEIIFSFAAALICAVYIATNDYYSGFYAIEKTSVNGRGRTAAAKYIAAIAAGAAVTVVFFVTSILVTWSTVGLSSPLVPIQCVETFRMCPYDMSILGFLAISLLLKLAAITVSVSVIVAVTSLTRKNLYGVVAGALVLLLGFIMSGLDITFGDFKYINVWSSYNIIDVLGRYRAIGVFNHSIPIILCVVCAFAALIAIGIGLHFLGFCHVKKPPQRQVIRLDFAKLFSRVHIPRPKPRYGTSLFYFEHRKRLWILPLLVILIIAKCDWATEYFERAETTYYRIYREYLEKLEGEYTPEKGEYIAEQYARNQEIYGMHAEVQAAFERGEISSKVLGNYLSEYAEAQAKLPVLEKLDKTSSYLARLYSQGIVGSFINEHEYYRFTNVGTDWYLTVYIWIMAVSAFMMERRKTSSSSPPEFLISTTPKGRMKTFGTKYLITLVPVLVATVIVKAIDLIRYRTNLAYPDGDALLVSLDRYSFAPANVTFDTHLALVLATSFVGALLSVTLLFVFAHLMRDALSTLVLSAAVMFVPGLLSAADVEIFNYMDLAKLTDTDFIYRLAGGSDMGLYAAFALVFVLIAIAVTVLGAISTSKVKKGN